MTRGSPSYLAAILLGGHPRSPSKPGTHIHEGALIGSETAAAGEAQRHQLLCAQKAGLGHPGNSFELGVFPLEGGV